MLYTTFQRTLNPRMPDRWWCGTCGDSREGAARQRAGREQSERGRTARNMHGNPSLFTKRSSQVGQTTFQKTLNPRMPDRWWCGTCGDSPEGVARQRAGREQSERDRTARNMHGTPSLFTKRSSQVGQTTFPKTLHPRMPDRWWCGTCGDSPEGAARQRAGREKSKRGRTV